jgi:hypothetical protein
MHSTYHILLGIRAGIESPRRGFWSWFRFRFLGRFELLFNLQNFGFRLKQFGSDVFGLSLFLRELLLRLFCRSFHF